MKRTFLFILLASFSLQIMAQTDALKIKASGRALFDGAKYFNTDNVDMQSGVSVADIRIGMKAYYGNWYLRGEVNHKQQKALFDGAKYFNTDNVDMQSGVSVADIRIGMKAYYGNWYLRGEVSYKQQKASLKDFYLQYNFMKNNYLRLGHYTVPFGLQSATGSADKEFLSDPEANIYQPGRRIGLMHTYYKNYIWLQYGVFADDSALKKSTDESGPQGYTLATRFVFKPLDCERYALHVGLSGLYRKADATQAGDHSAISYTKGWMTTVDKSKAIGLPVLERNGEWRGKVSPLIFDDAKWEFKYTPEITGYFHNYSFAAQYFGSLIKREGARIGNSDYRSSGYYITLRGIVLNPSDYSYSDAAACVVPPRDRSLELVLGYCVADFNDTDENLLDLSSLNVLPSFDSFMGIQGGRFMSVNLGLSFYWNKYVTFRAEYDYMTVSRLNLAKQKVNAIQFRAQYKF